MDFGDFSLTDWGNLIVMTGAVYSVGGRDLVLKFPGEDSNESMEYLEISHEQWKSLLLQTDHMETEILAKAKNGDMVKALIRKSTRQIDQATSWKVYRRDGYACRYCNAAEVPLTVDHLVLWEDGGPSVEANLVSACRPCNKARGNMEYDEWLGSKDYSRRSGGLTQEQRDRNASLLPTLAAIPRKYHVVSR